MNSNGAHAAACFDRSSRRDHSERLGDAFEYLLSVLGSQGDAGQFRTPRHIIDFIVSVTDPKKTETVLDPACGTAGFLISSYKHILKANTDAKGHSKLTPDEKGRLAKNFKGYDISPDMVRLSLVNLYLHGFTDPHIYEYDTLTSEERWNEFADVILANPPFMSPKGGIKPHKRFSIQAKRSEVLFVDYMAEHLTPNGRAGIIVPEGIIFQSQTAYKDLRDMKCSEISAKELEKYRLIQGDILFNRTNSFEHVGRTGIFDLQGDYCFGSYLIRLSVADGKADPFFVNAFMNSESFQQGIKQFASRAIGQSNINAKSLAGYPSPLPPIATQQAIVAEIEAEQALVAANRELIARFEKKIQATLARIWGEDEPTGPQA